MTPWRCIMVTGIVFDIKRYCVHDGPGLRTTVFMKGCPLSCRWCHNPEGRKPTVELMHRAARCIRCGECIGQCPNHAIHANGKPVVIDRQKCQACGICERFCPSGGIERVGSVFTVDQLVAEVAKDRVFFEESGGGVTFSGGEPLNQWEFLVEVLRECKALGLHTAVDTCGYASRESVEAAQPYVDLFLYDIKLMDRKRHIRYTGVPNDLIVENLGRLALAGKPVVVVLPLIPGVNDDDENIDELAEFVQDLGLGEISVLPFHRTGGDKFDAMGMPRTMDEFEEPTEIRVQEIKSRLVLHGLDVRVGRR